MALSGTLDTFSLPDVMRLLASTMKSGRLGVLSPSGSGNVWLGNGDVVAAEVDGDLTVEPTYGEVLFHLMRWETGSFTFEDDVTTTAVSTPQPMSLVLSQAEAMLVEWHQIQLVVPSMNVYISLCQELSDHDVVVDADRWRGIVAIGSGSLVTDVVRRMALNEVDACRLVKDLIESSLVEISESPVEVDEASVETPDSMDRTEPEVDDLFTFHDEGPLADSGHVSSLDPLLTAGDPLMDSRGDWGQPEEETLNPAEMARQLANLSPRAARAVAQAARATTDTERDALLAQVEAEDGTVNRSLLLRFLGSVDS